MTPSPEISVIVPCHTADALLGPCLDSLAAQTYTRQNFEVHVVDTGEDGAARVVASHASRFPGGLHLHRAERRGPGAQRNQGARAAAGRVLAFTDADCRPEAGWLEAGAAPLTRGAAVVQGATLPPEGEDPPWDSHHILVPGPSVLYEACNVFYDAAAFEAAGGFPTTVFDLVGRPFGEDTELAWRVRRAGGEAAFAGAAVVRHLVLRQGTRAHLRYEWQTHFFPYVVRRVPELRAELLSAGVFLGPRSIRTDAALASLLLAAVDRRALIGIAPYAAWLARTVVPGAPDARSAVRHAAKRVLADAIRTAALLSGSARFRSAVL